MKQYPYSVIINGEIIPANTLITVPEELPDTANKEVKENADSRPSGRARTRTKTG